MDIEKYNHLRNSILLCASDFHIYCDKILSEHKDNPTITHIVNDLCNMAESSFVEISNELSKLN